MAVAMSDLIDITPRKGSINPATQFKKGQSGNTKGRPLNSSECRQLAMSHVPELIELLMECARDQTERWSVRQTAVQAVLDRGLGKPVSMVDVSRESSGVVNLMSTDEIQQILLGSQREPLTIENKANEI